MMAGLADTQKNSHPSTFLAEIYSTTTVINDMVHLFLQVGLQIGCHHQRYPQEMRLEFKVYI